MQEESFKNLHKPLGPKIETKEKTLLYFGGTAYLGIPQNEDFVKLHIEGINKYGLNNGTSRGNNVQLAIYNEAEQFAANKYGAEASLITSSGYLAAQLTVKAIVPTGEVRYAPNTHPALWLNGNPQINGAFSSWAVDLVKEINSSKKNNWVIISNAIDNLYPERYNFSFLNEIAKEKQLLLIVDDSHGIGISNDGLSVLSSIKKQENLTILVVASMAKALGVDAGIVLGPQKIIFQLKASNEFLGASPPAAASLYAFMHAEEIYSKQFLKLKDHIKVLSDALKGNEQWHFIEDFPVFLSKNADISEKFLKNNILISSFPYPDKNGPIVNRIVLSSWHSKADINKLIKSL